MPFSFLIAFILENTVIFHKHVLLIWMWLLSVVILNELISKYWKKISVLVSNTVNIDRYNAYLKKLFGIMIFKSAGFLRPKIWEGLNYTNGWVH